MPKKGQQKRTIARPEILLPPSASDSGKSAKSTTPKDARSGSKRAPEPPDAVSPAELQAAQDAASDATAASPQHAGRVRRSTAGDPATVFSFRVRERICRCHEEVHGIVLQRVVKADCQGGAASFAGLAAELRAVTEARVRLRGCHGPQKIFRGGDVRRELMSVAASAILLAEAADRPEGELRRGEKSTAKQWLTPSFEIPGGES